MNPRLAVELLVAAVVILWVALFIYQMYRRKAAAEKVEHDLQAALHEPDPVGTWWDARSAREKVHAKKQA